MAVPANVGPGGGLVGPGGGLVGPATGVGGDFAVSHGQTVTFAGTLGYKGTFFTSHDHAVAVVGFPTFMEELSGTFIVDLIHRTVGWTATAYVPALPLLASGVVGSGSMIYAIPEEPSQIALEAHFLAEGVDGRFGGVWGQLAFEGTADWPNTPYGGRIDIPTRGLLVPVYGLTRRGEFCVGVQALAPGRVTIGVQAGSLGVAFDYLFVRTTVRIDGELVWSTDHESGGGLRIWGTNVTVGAVADMETLIFTGDLMTAGFTSEIEADVTTGAVITAGLEWVAGPTPAFLSVDPLAMGGVNLGHLWVAGTLGGEPLVASGSGSVA